MRTASFNDPAFHVLVWQYPVATAWGASRVEMGAGRDMGPDWIDVSAVAVKSDETLNYWLGVALEYNRALTQK